MTPSDPKIREIDIRQVFAISEKKELQIQPADQSDQRPSLPVRSRNALPSAYEAIRFGPSDWRNIILAAVVVGLGFFWTSHFFFAPEKFRPGMAREAEYLYKKPSQISDAIWNRSAETASHRAGINTNNPTATLAPDRAREASNGNNANPSFGANPPNSSQTGGSATGSLQANRSAAAGARSANASTSKATAARSVASKSARRTRTKQRRVALQRARTTGARLASHRSSASTRSSHAAPAATTGFALMEHSGFGKSTSLNMGSAHGPGLSVGGGIRGVAAHGSGGHR